MKKDFWWTLGLFLLFIAFAVGSMFWGGYLPIAYAFIISGVVGAAILYYFFRADATTRG